MKTAILQTNQKKIVENDRRSDLGVVRKVFKQRGLSILERMSTQGLNFLYSDEDLQQLFVENSHSIHKYKQRKLK